MPKRLTDAQLADVAREYKALDSEIKDLESKRDKLKTKLLREMERRDTTGITTGGVRISYVQQSRTLYNERRLRRILGSALWAKAAPRTLSKDALMDLVHSGDVDIAKVERCADVIPNAPYPSVTILEE